MNKYIYWCLAST